MNAHVWAQSPRQRAAATLLQAAPHDYDDKTHSDPVSHKSLEITQAATTNAAETSPTRQASGANRRSDKTKNQTSSIRCYGLLCGERQACPP
eukprot:5994924-Alexandrium_andersonii.AAC.1